VSFRGWCLLFASTSRVPATCLPTATANQRPSCMPKWLLAKGLQLCAAGLSASSVASSSSRGRDDVDHRARDRKRPRWVATTACAARLIGTSCDGANEDASQAVAEGMRGASIKQPSRCARVASRVVVPSSSICDGAGHLALDPLSGVVIVGLRWRDDRSAPARMCARVVV